MATGITKRHSRRCRSRSGGRCNCQPTFEAGVYSKRDGKKIRRSFDREAEAKAWRADATTALSRGELQTPKRITLDAAWEAWKAGAEAGTIRTRSGDRFKPAAVRGYAQGMRLRVLPEFGNRRLADVRRSDLQRFIYTLLEDGLSPRTIDKSLGGVRGVYRYAVDVGDVALNPTSGLKLPRSDARRDRVADAAEGARLIAAVPEDDRAYWATAMYGGLRRGEIQALRASDVDLAGGVIRVERGWDPKEGVIELKTKMGRRRVPIPALLRDPLLDHMVASGRSGDDLLFGRTPTLALRPESLQARADAAWLASGLERITPHEARHSFASLMIAAGVNIKALSTFMGHAKTGITLDLYGHLLPGGEEEAAGLLDGYLAAQIDRAEDAARAATGALTGAQLADAPQTSLI